MRRASYLYLVAALLVVVSQAAAVGQAPQIAASRGTFHEMREELA